MNVVVVMLDSLRQDHVACYGWDDVRVDTPHLDAFAAEAVLFDNVYPEGLPTIPVRTDLMTAGDERALDGRPHPHPLPLSSRERAIGQPGGRII